jgi:hypothetical protein
VFLADPAAERLRVENPAAVRASGYGLGTRWDVPERCGGTSRAEALEFTFVVLVEAPAVSIGVERRSAAVGAPDKERTSPSAAVAHIWI